MQACGSCVHWKLQTSPETNCAIPMTACPLFRNLLNLWIWTSERILSTAFGSSWTRCFIPVSAGEVSPSISSGYALPVFESYACAAVFHLDAMKMTRTASNSLDVL